MVLTASGTQLMDGSVPVRLNGVNDTTVLAWELASIMGQYPGYEYSNHNLPQYPVPGSSNSDKDCKIPSSSYKEFWYKYFWLLKYGLGGSISSAPPYGYHADVMGSTTLNHLRVGGHDEWGRSWQYKAFKDHRAQSDEAMKDLLEMAYVHGMYVNVTMGGGNPEDANFGTSGDLFTVGTERYNNFVQWAADYINAYGGYPILACFDLYNEPINFDASGKSPWWVARYGTAVVPMATSGLRQDYEAWEVAAIKWKRALLADVKAKVTRSPRPLITIGGGNYSIFWSIWDWHTQEVFEKEKKRAQDYSESDDLVIGHPYNGAEDDYLYNWNNQTKNFLNKPAYSEEWGYNQTGPPYDPPYSYWPYADLEYQKYGFNACVMVLRDMPAPTGSGLPKLPYPGYPIPQSMMDAAAAAWATYSATPPEPPPTPPTTVTVTLPPVKQGTLVIPLPTLAATLPPVTVSEKTVLVPAKSIPTVIPAQRVRTVFGWVTVPAQTVNVVIPASAITVPGEDIQQPNLVLPMPSVTVQLPDITIPPFDVVIPK
jgi:hypothetical protein